MLFTLPARSLDDIRDAMARGPVAVAYDQDNRRALATGKLLLVDNIIDQATATIRLKAMFPNDDEKLWPGEFVNAHVLLDTLAPLSSFPRAPIQRGPNGCSSGPSPPTTWRSRVRSRSAPYRDLTVVTSGLNGGERIVTDGQYKLQRNAPVAPRRRRPWRTAQLMNISEPFIRRPVATRCS